MDSKNTLALAMKLHAGGELDRAERAYRRILSKDRGNADAWQMLGMLLYQRGRTGDAIAHMRRAIAKAPGIAAFHGNLAECLRATGNFIDAAAELRQALVLAPVLDVGLANLGLVLRVLGNPTAAAVAFRRALAIRPGELSHHDRLFDLLRNNPELGDPCASLRLLCSGPLQSAASHHAYGRSLLTCGRAAEALPPLRKAVALAPGETPPLEILGRALADTSELLPSLALLRRVAATTTDRRGALAILADVQIKLNQARSALALLDQALANDAFDQELIMLRARCLAELGHPEAERVNDYAGLVLAKEIGTPEGYRTLSEFNDALAAQLIDLHRREGHRSPDQSLRGGTQTRGDLFASAEGPLLLLRAQLLKEAQAYLGTLEPAADHPFLARLREKPIPAGSWSILLRRQGFHVSHFDQNGWISGVYYVKVPAGTADPAGMQGWLKLGEPSEGIGRGRLVTPRPGTVVFFPSYFMHGTTPFEGDDIRLTVAFDFRGTGKAVSQRPV
ncbi:MAG: tetratricopeptide repeat protein [Alphaproteobacteria bacterium]|nr:tetratricopeptide repeat protein [Alphaproteobacteria bacterium]